MTPFILPKGKSIITKTGALSVETHAEYCSDYGARLTHVSGGTNRLFSLVSLISVWLNASYVDSLSHAFREP